MSQERYIELGKLIKTLEQELLKSSLKVQSAELELKVVVNQENDDLKIYILDSGTETDWQNLHTLKVNVSQDTGEPSGGSNPQPISGFKVIPPQDPNDPPGGSGHSLELGKPLSDSDPNSPPGGSGAPDTPPGGSDTPSGG